MFITDTSHPCGSEGSLILKRAMNCPETTVVSEFLGVVIAGTLLHPSVLALSCDHNEVFVHIT